MINTSTAFATALNAENRQFKHKLSVTFSDGTTTEITNSAIISIKVKASTSSASDFGIGGATSTQIDIMLNNIEGGLSDEQFASAKINYQVGLVLADATTEYINKGTYIVSKTSESGRVISLTAFDYMYTLDVDYASTLVYPRTILQIVQDICTRRGIVLKSTTFPMSTFSVARKPVDCTERQVLAYCSQIIGGCAVMDSQNKLEFRPPSATSVATINKLVKKTLDRESVTITGIKVKAKGTTSDYGETKTSGTSGYMLSISDNPLITEGKAQTVATHLGTIYNGLVFFGSDITTLSDPRIEHGDKITIQVGTETFATYATNVTFNASNKLQIKCGVKSKEQQSKQSYSIKTDILQEANANTSAVFNEYETRVNNLNDLACNSFGLHHTSVEQEDGSYIELWHDKPTLTDSTNVYKFTADGFFISTDGGTTFTSGWDSNGDAVMNILSVIGLNAEWINTGSFKATKSEWVAPSVIDQELVYKIAYDGTVTPTAQQIAWYDYNCNGVIDPEDYYHIGKIIRGLNSISYYEMAFGYQKPTFLVTVDIDPSNPRRCVKASGTAYGREYTSSFGTDGCDMSSGRFGTVVTTELVDTSGNSLLPNAYTSTTPTLTASGEADGYLRKYTVSGEVKMHRRVTLGATFGISANGRTQIMTLPSGYCPMSSKHCAQVMSSNRIGGIFAEVEVGGGVFICNTTSAPITIASGAILYIDGSWLTE